jgi:hypothetical protein
MRNLVLAAVVVAAGAAPAFAGYVSPTNITAYSTSGGGTNPAIPPPAGGVSAAPVRDIDGVYFNSGASGWAANSTLTMTLSIPTDWGTDLRVFMTVAGVGGVPDQDGLNADVWQVTSLVFSDGVGTATANQQHFIHSGEGIVFDSFTLAGGFNANNVNSLTFTITNAGRGDGGGGQFQFDAITNPEPGAFALFGLGAMGLGGYAWRRRKLRLAAKKS